MLLPAMRKRSFSSARNSCGLGKNIIHGAFLMGKSIALLFACAALVVVAGSFMAPTTVAARKGNCAPAYGVDPCTTTGTIGSAEQE